MRVDCFWGVSPSFAERDIIALFLPESLNTGTGGLVIVNAGCVSGRNAHGFVHDARVFAKMVGNGVAVLLHVGECGTACYGQYQRVVFQVHLIPASFEVENGFPVVLQRFQAAGTQVVA